MKKLLVPLVLIPALVFSQSRKERKAMQAQQKADQQVVNNLKSHVQNLVAGKTGSQQTPSNTVADAATYVANQFKAEGLQPKGSNGYFQPFTAFDGKKIDSSTYLKVHDNLLEINTEYFPLPYSAEKKVTGRPAMALRERGVPWFADMKDWLEDAEKTGGNLQELIKKEVVKVAGKGATALFLYNSGKTQDGVIYDKKDKSSALSIPVIFLTPQGYMKYFSDNSQTLEIDVNVRFKESNITGNNVIGYLDNSSSTTIVVGAHYNLREDKNMSSQKPAETGADDNGSGIGMLIELARMLSASKAKNNNYLFIALGGSDLGASAASYWLANSTVTTPVNYMLNLDMVGSYDESKKLTIQGYTSSPVWDLVFDSITDKKIALSIDSTKTIDGPIASFYEKGIPVLSFSAGAHSDYVNKSDEEGRINYPGELQIAKFINKLVEAADSRGKIAFDKSTLHIIASTEKRPEF